MFAAMLAAGMLLMQAGPAAAPVAPAPSSTVAPAIVTGKKIPASAKDPNEVVCKSEPVLGTLFPKKTCATRGEMAARRALDQQTTRESTNLRPYRDPSGD